MALHLKKGQITLSQGKMKKDDLADDEDDDVERTSVSRDRVTVTLCAVQLRSLVLDTGRWCTMDLCSALPSVETCGVKSHAPPPPQSLTPPPHPCHYTGCAVTPCSPISQASCRSPDDRRGVALPQEDVGGHVGVNHTQKVFRKGGNGVNSGQTPRGSGEPLRGF